MDWGTDDSEEGPLQDVKVTDQRVDTEAQAILQDSPALAELSEERVARSAAWASRASFKLDRDRNKQDKESVPLLPVNHVSPMDIIIAKWEKKVLDKEADPNQHTRRFDNTRSSVNHSRPTYSDSRAHKKPRLNETSVSPQALPPSQLPSSTNTLFSDLHAMYECSDEEDDPESHPNKLTPIQRALVRQGLNAAAKERGEETKAQKKNRKRKEKKARAALSSGLPSIIPAPPAPPAVFPPPPATPLAPERLDELGLPEIDYVDDDEMCLDGALDHPDQPAMSLTSIEPGVRPTDINPMEQFIQELSGANPDQQEQPDITPVEQFVQEHPGANQQEEYQSFVQDLYRTYPIEPDEYLVHKYSQPDWYRHTADKLYGSKPPPDPEPSSPEEPEDDSERSWDSEDEDLQSEWAAMSRLFSLHGQALEEVAEYKIYFVRCQVRVST